MKRIMFAVCVAILAAVLPINLAPTPRAEIEPISKLVIETVTPVSSISLPDPLWIPEPGDADELAALKEQATALAKVVWAEARSCPPEEQALVCWTAFQRVDDPRWPDTLIGVLTQPRQFIYREGSPVDAAIYALCVEEISKWARGDAPPTHAIYAPTTPYYFYDGDGSHNYFREAWK